MNRNISTRLAGGLCAALCASLIVIACTGTTSFRVGANIAGQEGSAEFNHDSSTRKVKITNSTGEPMDVGFRDANGNPVGGTTTGVPSGGSVDVPAGATEVVVTTPATPPSGGTGGHMAEIGDGNGAFAAQQVGAHQRAVPAQLRTYRIRVAPLVADEDGSARLANVSFDCNVLAPVAGWDAQQEGWALISPILLAGPGTPVPSNVEIVSFVCAQREKLGMRIVAADVGHFTAFTLDWNGQFGYADLAAGHGVQSFATGNGWEVCEAFIPLADFGLPTTLNGGFLTLANTSDSQPQMVSMFVEFFL
jgi:hypothetical protein